VTLRPTILLCLLGALACAVASAQQSPAAPPGPKPAQEGSAGALLSDPQDRLELALPAPYWLHYDRRQLEEQVRGGCVRQQVPPEVLYVIRHKDAQAGVLCLKSPRPFLMRSKADLEALIGSITEAVARPFGESIQVLESKYGERDGMITHRYAFTASVGGGSGCAGGPQSGGAPQKMRFLMVHYFVREDGGDATYFELRAYAPAEVYQALAPEIDSILDGLRYTGKPAAEFFVPDAPEDRVLTGKEAVRSATGRRGSYGWMLAVGMIVIIWMLLRRRKQAMV